MRDIILQELRECNSRIQNICDNVAKNKGNEMLFETVEKM